jgi:uncharacterized protein (DUF924 family)
MTAPDDVLVFWREAGPDRWYARDDAFDAAIRTRFLATYEAAAAGRLEHWQTTPDGTLALLILLDQFPRNLFRGDARAFATDAAARAAEPAIARIDQRVDAGERVFFYLPFEHSRRWRIRRVASRYTARWRRRLPECTELHADIIARFGRFPCNGVPAAKRRQTSRPFWTAVDLRADYYRAERPFIAQRSDCFGGKQRNFFLFVKN